MAFNVASKKWQLLLALAATFVISALLGGGKVYADCGITNGNIHDFAGLDVGFDSSSGSSNFSNVTVTVRTLSPSYSNSDGGFNSNGTGYYNLFNSNNSGQRTTSAIFPATNNDNCVGGSGYGVTLSHNGTADVNGNKWELDCDYSYRAEDGGPQANKSLPFQEFAVYPSGTPNGLQSGGYWTVSSFSPADPQGEDTSWSSTKHITGSSPQVIAPANGDTAKIVFLYHEPTPPPNPDVNASTAESGNTFYHKSTITKASNSNAANFSWRVQSYYCDATSTGAAVSTSTCLATGDSNWTTTSRSGGDGPISDNKTVTVSTRHYSFPSSASNNDKYCERLELNPGTNTNEAAQGDGGNDVKDTQNGSWWHDNGMCVTDDKGNLPQCKSDTYDCNKGDAPTISPSCDGASFSIGGSTYPAATASNGDPLYDSGVRYALWAYSDDGSGTKPPAWSNSTSYGGHVPWYYTGAKNSNGSWQTASYGDVYDTDSTPGDYNADTTDSYSLVDNNQIMSGNVTYYLVTYNYTGSDSNQPSGPPSGSTYYVDYTTSATAINCYEATCTYTVTGLFTDGDTFYDGSVQAGQSYNVSVTMTNTGSNDIADPMDDSYPFPLSATEVNGGTYTEHAMGQGDLESGQSITQTFGFTAPSSLTSFTPSLYPDYYGRGEINSDTTYRCSGPTITTYEPFTLTPTATAQPDSASGATDENPKTIDYSTYVTNSADVQVNLPSGTIDVSKVYYMPTGGSEVDQVGPVGTSSYAAGGPDYTINPGSWSPTGYVAGDKYCAEITLTYNGGYVDSNGDTMDDTTTATSGGNPIPLDATDCITVIDEPYVSVYGADVSAGGGFDGGPSDANGGVYTNSYSRNSPLTLSGGSGTQLGALSAGPIEGFASATLRSSAPTGPTGLSFANTTNTSGSGMQDADNLGGDLGTTNTITNYFADIPSGTSNSPVATATVGNSSGAQEYTPVGGTLVLHGNGSIGNGVREAIYVNGNVEITGNITYGNDNWDSGSSPIDNIPSFYLIATGNIYVDGSVSQLDGVYVAQPDAAGANGGIYTCYSGNAASPRYAESNIFNNCRTQLLVNGGFVAQEAYLDRSFGSLRDSTGNDTFRPGTNKTCTYTTSGVYNTSNLGTCAAEIFNYSPELYLVSSNTTAPDISPTSGPTLGKYDYVTSLSPVL